MRELLSAAIYLANRLAADYVISVKQMSTARARVEMFERESQDMCLSGSCRNAVAGKAVFLHCDKHLDETERRWLKDDVETKGWGQTPREDVHPLVRQIRELSARTDETRVSRNIEVQQAALASARDTVATFWDGRKLEDQLLPAALLAGLRQSQSQLIDLDSEL